MKHVVVSRRCDLEAPFCVLLAFYVFEVEFIREARRSIWNRDRT